ncbi:MAG: TrbG/VirB9 family P-type conjugative transfer protein [Pseudomonadota bacterium]
MPSQESPRIQTAVWQDGQSIKLMALPETALTVMLEPGETITRVVLTGNALWDISVSAETDTFQAKPRTGAEAAELSVETNLRTYQFGLEVGEGLLGAYMVRLQYGGEEPQFTPPQPVSDVIPIEGLNWSYRLRGDKSVRPASIKDNGTKTVIRYAPGQSLPAVFAIGATGDEEVVDGYMRGDRFVIDRVHKELVFRIDKEKATARRNKREDARDE